MQLEQSSMPRAQSMDQVPAQPPLSPRPNEYEQLQPTAGIVNTQVHPFPVRQGTRRLSSIRAKPDSTATIHKNVAEATFSCAIGQFCTAIQYSISLHFMGKINSATVTAYGLAVTLINQMLQSTSFGINITMNILIAQALGKKKPEMPIQIFNTTIYAHFMYFIPLGIMLIFISPFYRLFVKEDVDEVIGYIQTISIYLVFTALAQTLFETVKQYLYGYNVIKPFTYIYLFTTPIYYLIGYYLSEAYAMNGILLSILLTEILNLICFFIYLFIFGSNCFRGLQILPNFIRNKDLLKQFISISVPNIIHLQADWAIATVMNFLSPFYGNQGSNVQLALQNTSTIYYKIPLSFSSTLSIFLGQKLGSDQLEQAKQYIKAIWIQYFAILSILLVIIFSLREYWARFYTSDETIYNKILDAQIYFVFGCLIFDGIQGVYSGVFKGLEMPNVVSYSTIIGYYIIGVPFMILLSYPTGLEVRGIWLGFGIANFCLILYYTYKYIGVDWNMQIRIIQSKIQEYDDVMNQIQQNDQQDHENQQENQQDHENQQQHDQIEPIQ